MKEFSLYEFKKNLSQKVVTRDGRSVRIVCTDAKNEFPIVALVTNDDKEVLMDYNNNGKVSSDEITDFDLFFAPIKKEGWINLYWSIGGDKFVYPGGTIYESKEEAMNNNNLDYITSVKIEWKE